mmetsp:Transcript_25204/g.72635  ORF Transcript_25204/g.72635 Transcript_25204/m.72635 type:complete len:489 (+) Transcript_25204:1274-2740(+)
MPERGGLVQGESALELSGEVHGREHVRGHAVQSSRLNLALCDELGEVAVVLALGHLNVEARLRGLLGVVRGSPITNCVPLEAEVLAQELRQQVVVLAGMMAIDLVVGAHHRARAGFKSRLEYGHVDLVLRPLADDRRHRLPVDFLVVVQPVLDGGDDALILHGLDVRPDQLAAQKGVLPRKSLEPPAGQCRSGHLNIWAQQDVRALEHELLRHRRRVPPGGLRIEGRRHGQQSRELGGRAGEALLIGVEALGAVVHLQREDVPAQAGGVQESGVAAAARGTVHEAHLVFLGEGRDEICRVPLCLEPALLDALQVRRLEHVLDLRTEHLELDRLAGAYAEDRAEGGMVVVSAGIQLGIGLREHVAALVTARIDRLGALWPLPARFLALLLRLALGAGVLAAAVAQADAVHGDAQPPGIDARGSCRLQKYRRACAPAGGGHGVSRAGGREQERPGKQQRRGREDGGHVGRGPRRRDQHPLVAELLDRQVE